MNAKDLIARESISYIIFVGGMCGKVNLQNTWQRMQENYHMLPYLIKI